MGEPFCVSEAAALRLPLPLDSILPLPLCSCLGGRSKGSQVFLVFSLLPQDDEVEDATYEEALSVQLRRDRLEKWVNEVFFNEVVEVRCREGPLRPLFSLAAPLRN